MKKVCLSLLVLLLCSSFVFSAGNTESAKSAEQVGMTFSNWSGAEASSKDIFEWMISSFNNKVEDVDKVVQINWPWGETESQLALRAQGKEQYDVAQIDIRMLPALAEAGVLADLNQVFGKEYFTSNFTDGSIAVGNFNGIQYGLSWTVAPMALIANPKILAESGVNFEIVTIADFEKALKMVKENHPANNDSDKNNDIVPYAAITKDSGTVAPDFMVWLCTF